MQHAAKTTSRVGDGYELSLGASTENKAPKESKERRS